MSTLATGPACSAINGVQGKINGAELPNLPPEQVTEAQSKAKLATTAVDALGDNVPSEVSSKLDAAQQKLDTAVSDTKASVEERKTNLKSAADD